MNVFGDAGAPAPEVSNGEKKMQRIVCGISCAGGGDSIILLGLSAGIKGACRVYMCGSLPLNYLNLDLYSQHLTNTYLCIKGIHCFLMFLVTINWSTYFSNGQIGLYYQMRNDMSTIFLQQILNGKLLLVVIVGAKK